MAETIPGGASLVINKDGSERWVDAEGRPLSKDQIAEAQRLDEERNADLRANERMKLEAEARRDPTARAIAAALAPAPQAAAPESKSK